MKLDDLCELIAQRQFPAADAREHPLRESVTAARAAVTAAVRDDEFLVDCMAHELDVMERRVPRQGLVPFYTLPGLGITFAFGYWPPAANAGAHEHTAWTITAVCRNKLNVQTYDYEKSYHHQTLVAKNLFEAPAGRVGFIYEPGIHDPCNPTNRWSLSLHVTSPRDGETIADQRGCLPVLRDSRAQRFAHQGHPYAWVGAARYQRVLIHQVASFLAAVGGDRAQSLLARCLRLSSATTHRFICAVLGSQLEPTEHSLARTLTLAHQDLTLGYRDATDFVALGVETPSGWIEQLRMSQLAREAVAFCANTHMFTVRELPGRLTGQERCEIAEALQDSGMFIPWAS
jgi:hypothetical protein